MIFGAIDVCPLGNCYVLFYGIYIFLFAVFQSLNYVYKFQSFYVIYNVIIMFESPAGIIISHCC